MSNHRKSQNPEKQVATKEEVEKFNERPYWTDAREELGTKIVEGLFVPTVVPKKEVFETLKKEINIDETSLKVEKLEIYKYLTDEAKALYDSPLHTTVLEYFHDPHTGEMWVNPSEEEEYKDYLVACSDAQKGLCPYPCLPEKYLNQGIERKTALMGYVGITVMTDKEGTITESINKRFAAVLNELAERNIWYFGTLMFPMSMSLGLFADGTTMLETSYDPINGFGYKQREGEGRRVMLLAYIGIHPRLQDGVWGDAPTYLFSDQNVLHVAADGITESDIPLDEKTTIFVDEGRLPKLVWDGREK